MFGKLKEKLKEKLSIFSRKTKEEAEEKVVKEEQIVEKTDGFKNVDTIDTFASKEKKSISTEKINQKTISAEELIAESLEEEQDESKDVEDKIRNDKIKKEKFTPLIVKEKRPFEVKEQEEERKIAEESKQKPIGEEKKTIKTKEREEREEERKEETRKEQVVKKEIKKADEIIRRTENIRRTETVEEKEDKSKEKQGGVKKEERREKEEERKRDEERQEKDEEPEKTEQPLEKQSFFGKIKQALTTKTISGEKFEELFWDLEITLLENNVSVEVIEKIKEDLQRELVDKPLPRDVEGKILETLKQTLSEILEFTPIELLSKIKEKNKDKKSYIIAFFGINGAGKTTSIAKLTRYFQKQGLSVVLAACDTFRAAAIQQLQEHADILKVKMIKQDYGSDAAAVAFDAIKYAEKNNIHVVLIDTAGRLHSNTNLMAELEKLIRVSKPDLKIFVGESITGNDCIEQARQFNALVEQDGIILTKADIDEKGGAPLSISYVIKKPILFLGMGQKYEDLEVFDKEKILQRLGL